MSMLARNELQPARHAVLYGAGGHARELRHQLEDDGVSVQAFVDDLQPARCVDGLAVLSFDQARFRFADSHWFVAVGDIGVRARLAAQVMAAGLPLGRFVSRGAYMLPSARVGTGVQVFHGAVLSAAVTLGDFGLVNFGCVLSHDVQVGAYATLCPGAHVAGHVLIGERVWIGIGATIRNGRPDRPLVIGDGAFIAAGACVVGDVPPGALMTGIPARAHPGNDRSSPGSPKDSQNFLTTT